MTGTGYSMKGMPVLDIDTRRLDRAARKAANLAAERGTPLDTLPSAAELLAEADARDRHDRHALGGIGRIVASPFVRGY